MNFKAVIITKSNIKAVLISVILVITAVILLFVFTKGRIKNSDIYKNIIDESLGTMDINSRTSEISNELIGFDITEPSTIIDTYLGIENSEDMTVKKGEGMDIYEEKPESEVQLATKAEICEGKNISLNNATDYEIDMEALCKEDLNFKLTNEDVEVLIVHTHTTECYTGDEMDGASDRTTNEEKNVIAIGNIIKETLEGYGIKVYHDKTFHDYPSYQGSYTRSLATVNSMLNKYPEIKVVLDVHRDAFVYEDGTKLTVTRKNAKVPTSQVMIVSGSDSMGLENPNWRENLKFAAKIQSAAQVMYPGLMRSVNLRSERFNLHTTTGSLIIEVGSNGNTLEEAKNAARCIGRAISAVLLN